jgi:hypothetical protein
LKLRELQIFNLDAACEKDDDVAVLYRKSLLYLVSNAFEGERGRPLLGMQKFAGEVRTVRGLPRFRYSNGSSGDVTRAKGHGDFDNDPYTMNSILGTVLGRRAGKPFTPKELQY